MREPAESRPTRQRGVRPAGLPAAGPVSNFLELNVRTYVHDERGVPGVWYYSLDCNLPLAVVLAQTLFRPPYRHAAVRDRFAETVSCESTRRGTGTAARYVWQPHGGARTAAAGSLEFFLLERYHLHAARGGNPYRGTVVRPPCEFRAAGLREFSAIPAALDGFSSVETAPRHICHADGAGKPGTAVTFFDWPVAPGVRGTNGIIRTGLRVGSMASLAWWRGRLGAKTPIIGRDGRPALDFEDPEGQRLSLVVDAEPGAASRERSSVPPGHQIRGLGPVTIAVRKIASADRVLRELPGMDPARAYGWNGNETRVYRCGETGGAAREVHMVEQPGSVPARRGAGGVHHLALRTKRGITKPGRGGWPNPACRTEDRSTASGSAASISAIPTASFSKSPPMNRGSPRTNRWESSVKHLSCRLFSSRAAARSKPHSNLRRDARRPRRYALRLMSKEAQQRMEKIVSLCKRRGFIFQSSEIYGGLNGFWDYGPMGVELKRNLKDFWWRRVVHEREDMVGMDGSIIMNRAVWKASGHEDTFSDPMVDCKTCKARHRADQLPRKDGVPYCPACGGRDLTEPRAFNLMLKSYAGPLESDENLVYLRPETAQAMFVQFKNVLETSRKKLPFGIAQIGKAFRNEINPRNYTFRSREFEQMEIEYFCRAEDGLALADYWLEERLKFYEDIGIPRSKIKIHDIPDGERAFYSKKTYDLEYEFPFGVSELEGVAYRTDYDLSAHIKHSGKPLEYFDDEKKEKFVPHVVEPSAGVDRTALALICEAFAEEEVTDEKGNKEVRTVLRFHPRMAPVKCGVFPLLKNKPALVGKARSIAASLRPHMMVFYDEAGAIGRRYRRQDEIGTPFCVTVDFDTIGENGPENAGTITLRHRDSMGQERIPIAELRARLEAAIF